MADGAQVNNFQVTIYIKVKVPRKHQIEITLGCLELISYYFLTGLDPRAIGLKTNGNNSLPCLHANINNMNGVFAPINHGGRWKNVGMYKIVRAETND